MQEEIDNKVVKFKLLKEIMQQFKISKAKEIIGAIPLIKIGLEKEIKFVETRNYQLLKDIEKK